MPQVINTNIGSLNAQRNLDTSTGGLAVSLQRLSSGLRINSAKDDAAGLAIATRFTSRIQGLVTAQRNANDAISLSQVSEGALQETTKILQRGRELAIQSANGSNSAADRKALQAEVNQLKQELTRISTTTTFNGLQVLDGSLSNTAFQIGAEANQTVNVSISDTRTSAIGTNTVTTNNTAGIEQATHIQFLGGGTDSDAAGVGTDIGLISATDNATNTYAATTFTVTNTLSTGAANVTSVATVANESAKDIAATLSTVSGVTATAFNQITISNLSFSDTNDTISLHAGETAGSITMDLATGDSQTFSEMATLLNANTDFSNAGIYAVSSASNIQIFATNGEDFIIQGASTAGGTVGFSISQDFNVDAAGSADFLFDSDAVEGTAESSVATGGRVDIQLDANYTIAADDTGILGGTAATTLTTQASGLVAITSGNNVAAQTITISGSTGSTAISTIVDDEASSIVTKINAVSGVTNVKASAITNAQLRGLSADGTVTFNLYGDNLTSAPSAISAAVTTTDLTALAKAINDQSGATGVTAATDGDNGVLLLTQSTGRDIRIENFTHSAGVDFQAPTSDAPVTGDGSAVVAATNAYLEVLGNRSGNLDASGNYTGTTIRLYEGGNETTFDSTVVGGQVSLSSSSAFSVSSDVAGASATTGDPNFAGSLFSVGANAGNASSATTVNAVDISTIAGAQSAIDVLDEAINQISSIRADLGAVQSRFESAIRNIGSNVENLNVARSRILDTDFAAETATLTKNQILSQAGVSILAQANSLPQNVLALLQ